MYEQVPYDPLDLTISPMVKSDPHHLTIPVESSPSSQGLPTSLHLADGNGACLVPWLQLWLLFVLSLALALSLAPLLLLFLLLSFTITDTTVSVSAGLLSISCLLCLSQGL